MSGRGASLALGLLGILAGLALQLLIGASLNALGLFLIALATTLALIVPVIATMPLRRARIATSPASRKAVYIALAVALFFAWIILIAVSIMSAVQWFRIIVGLALLGITPLAWIIMSFSLGSRPRRDTNSA